MLSSSKYQMAQKNCVCTTELVEWLGNLIRSPGEHKHTQTQESTRKITFIDFSHPNPHQPDHKNEQPVEIRPNRETQGINERKNNDERKLKRQKNYNLRLSCIDLTTEIEYDFFSGLVFEYNVNRTSRAIERQHMQEPNVFNRFIGCIKLSTFPSNSKPLILSTIRLIRSNQQAVCLPIFRSNSKPFRNFRS